MLSLCPSVCLSFYFVDQVCAVRSTIVIAIVIVVVLYSMPKRPDPPCDPVSGEQLWKKQCNTPTFYWMLFNVDTQEYVCAQYNGQKQTIMKCTHRRTSTEKRDFNLRLFSGRRLAAFIGINRYFDLSMQIRESMSVSKAGCLVKIF